MLAVVVGTATSQKLGAAASLVYRNENYGYIVTVPRASHILRSIPPNPEHGFEILSDVAARLWIDFGLTRHIRIPRQPWRRLTGKATAATSKSGGQQ